MPTLTILADDLTGACDTGTLFAGPGPVPVTVWPGPPAAAAIRVVDTESRALRAEAARERVRAAVRGAPATRYFKKIDSTLRGPVGAEIEAVMDETGISTALVCPAFPAQGRTVVDRMLLVDGRPVMETTFAEDILAGGRNTARPSSSVEEILRSQVRRPVAWIPLADVRADGRAWRAEDSMAPERQAVSGPALRDQLRHLAGTVTVADAETETDLDVLVTAALDVEPAPLLVGSAGLGSALARRLGREAGPATLPGAPWLILVGSLHPVSRCQAKRARQSGLRVLVTDDRPVDAGEADPRPAVVERLAARAMPIISDLLGPPATTEASGATRSEKPVLIAVTGGETAVALYRALDGTRLDLVGAPAPGVALGRLQRSSGGRLWLLTKAGGFGNPDLFVRLHSAARESPP